MASSVIGVRRMSEADNGEMSKLLGDVFSRRDPPAVATNFSPVKLEKIAMLFGSKSAKEGLSSVAFNQATGEIVGAVLAHDFGQPPPDGIDALDLDSEPVIALIDELESVFSNAYDIQAEKFLHIFMIAVRDDFSRRGIAQSLLVSCLKQAENSGYRIAFAEATNSFSQSLFSKAGFVGIHSIGYEDFEINGQRPFLDIKDEGACALMELDLSA
ncbi:GNAT family N-acetyltransferase [Ruegeria conchae]|uniref:GNAT family N-acetyltransferase n=1 Tax=Ruegeria conchae TaxID=981384 RepID=UPI00147DEEA4|nr:GNAT family N-acetyltransferase [Ruegeria conchae]UWR02663.1 GNAT family N-acetyltransferase [Ruegeria conchae]